jgi:hypothetical protein
VKEVDDGGVGRRVEAECPDDRTDAEGIGSGDDAGDDYDEPEESSLSRERGTQSQESPIKIIGHAASFFA